MGTFSKAVSVIFSATLCACGARTALGDPSGNETTASDGGAIATGSCGTGKGTVVVVTVDPPDPLHEPESAPHLVWTGSELLLAWTRWTNGQYEMRLAALQLGAGTVTVSASTSVDPGNTDNPFNSSIAWDGTSLARFWAQDDGSIVMQRFRPDTTPLGDRSTVFGPTTGQTIPSGVLFSQGAFLLTFAVEIPDGWVTSSERISPIGKIAAGPTLLYTGSGYDLGATLLSSGDRIFAVWSTHPETSPETPVTTVLATIEPGTGGVLTTETVDVGMDHGPTGIAAEATRLDIAVGIPFSSTSVFSRDLAGSGAFTSRLTLDSTDGIALAAGDCGLAALVPSGQYKMDNPLSNALAVQRLGEQGVLGDALTLPVQGEWLESYSFIAVPGGYVAAWVEGGNGEPQQASRALRVAYVTFD